MTQNIDRKSVEKALEHNYSNKAVEHYLKQALGQETNGEEVGEHLFMEHRSYCVNPGCDMPKKYSDLIASDYNCPTTMEAWDMDARVSTTSEGEF